ncbi:transcription initiation factor IIF, beta subunit-domain-containing protein [Sphaerosporella brunnea]|uniref:Transcription initiation factor IIF subunit beta n=1 Tax=Sphaerosporella brunnea TaxID=1250544 RepID=A0A5J5F838_9PEZI|nr:transcription initiation factor IIF, beta subunit-domain-containing protein [Sphaerosporella brunnea]
MAAPNVKVEPGEKMEPGTKSEPGLTPPEINQEMGYADDDELYEDAGDLDLTHGDRAVWLVKLPQFLAERWKDIDEDEEITLGVVKVDPNNQSQVHCAPPSSRVECELLLKLMLEKNAINGEDIPTEYDLSITNMEVTNTFVFTEKDMPGYESKMETGVKEGDPAMPSRFLFPQRQREREKSGEPGGPKKPNRYQPYVRKAIPKRTALVGTAKHECAVLPVYNEEYRRFQMNRTLKEDAPQYSTKFLDDARVPGNLLTPGTTGTAAAAAFSNFIKPVQPIRKATDNKSFRIAREDLISSLFKHFEEHEYWTMKGFREVTNQPEAYLKEVLEEIAIMNRSGPYNGKWSLKPEFKQRASEGGTADHAIDLEDEDEEVEMEDVPFGTGPPK